MLSNSVPSVPPTTVKQTRLMVVVVPDTVTAVAAGAQHSLALGADGRVWTCGVLLKSKDKDPVQVSGLKSIIAIAAGGGFSLALRADGTVWSWGVNDKGQLGDGTTKSRKKPVPVKGLTNIVAIDAGRVATTVLALDVGGNVWSWGFNTTGQLGDGTVKSRPTPELVHNLDRVIAIAAGGAHSLALRADGTVRAWGGNGKGQLGDGSTNSARTANPGADAQQHCGDCRGASTAWRSILRGRCGPGVPTASVRSAMTQPWTASPTRLRFWTGRAAPSHSI